MCLPSISCNLREGYKREALPEIILCAKQQWSLYSHKDEQMKGIRKGEKISEGRTSVSH